MLNEKISAMLNAQFNAELYSAYLYLAYADRFGRLGLDGFANWYKVQAQEELDHALIFRRYLASQGEPVLFDAVDEVSAADMKIPQILGAAADHERAVTAMINDLHDAASAEGDLRTVQLLDWFVREQAEEEDNAGEMIDKYRVYSHCCSGGDRAHTECGTGCGGGLYALNRELSRRGHSVTEYPL